MLAICETLPSLKSKQLTFPIFGKASLNLRQEHALSTIQRAEIKRRMATMVFTNEFDRVPECPLSYAKQQVMEQLIRMVDCVFPLLFADVSMLVLWLTKVWLFLGALHLAFMLCAGAQRYPGCCMPN